MEENEIIQIAPPHKWGGCLAVIDEVRIWGVQAYVSIPHNDGQAPERAYIRLQTGEYETVGARAVFVPATPSNTGRE